MLSVQLTGPMQDYVQGRIASGAYADEGEVMRAGLRLLMEREGARQFYALKAELEKITAQVEAGDVVPFDPVAFEPDAFAE